MHKAYTKRRNYAEGGLEGCAIQGQIHGKNACTIVSDLVEREYNNLCYKEAHASCDDGRRREPNSLVCCSLLRLVQLHLRLFGAFKVKGKCRK